MISRLSKEALDQGLGIADGRVNDPQALHRRKKRFVGRDAPMKEHLRRAHYGRFPKNSRLPQSGVEETGGEPISYVLARKRDHQAAYAPAQRYDQFSLWRRLALVKTRPL
jgi:hypothetical protein